MKVKKMKRRVILNSLKKIYILSIFKQFSLRIYLLNYRYFFIKTILPRTDKLFRYRINQIKFMAILFLFKLLSIICVHFQNTILSFKN